MNSPRVFIAGTMQGASNGLDLADQSYRKAIRDLVKQRWPKAECFDPSEPVQELTKSLASDPDLLERFHAMLSGQRVDLDGLPEEVQRFRSTFRDMTARARDCDLLIAYLPGTTPSMGTAMEMYQAFLASVPVVAVTEMRMNLSIISTANWVLSGLDELQSWLSTYRFERPKETRDDC